MKQLEVKHLKKYFPVADGVLHALDDVTLSVDTGETLGVVGESGCGKSTLGKTVLRLTEPTSGEIFFEGQDVSKLSGKEFKHLRTEMQMIFQDPFSSLDPRMSVSQLIAEPLQIYKKTSGKAETARRVRELMDIVGLANRFEKSYPHELDGGRRQRIGIARALSLEPKFIVCDEPVSALDVSIQAQVLNLLQDLQKERKLTYMFITHDLSVVKYISDRIGVMYLGNMVELAPADDIFKHPLHPYTEALLNAIPTTDEDAAKKPEVLEGDIPSPVNPPKGCKFHTRCKYCTEICTHVVPEMQEVRPNHFVACHHILEKGSSEG